jgi:pyruvate/2-oxoglutarate dehydrogenase complex dihydrolipoamide acyltransferase (E2) component
MATTIKLPKLGDCAEANVTAILVKTGDFVEEDTVICEIESEKVNFEVKAQTSGWIKKILIDLNQPIFTDDPIAVIGDKSENIQ